MSGELKREAVPVGSSIAVLDAGRAVRLRSVGGVEAIVLPLGGTLQSLSVPDRDGKLDDVVLGLESPMDYESPHGFFGSTVGRIAGRFAGDPRQRCPNISTAEGTFPLEACDAPFIGKNHLHGGPVGFDKCVWTIVELEADSLDAGGEKLEGIRVKLREVQDESAGSASVIFALESGDGDQGFPGALSVTLQYTLTAGNALQLDYEATTTRATPCSLTNHTYFNLAGHEAGAVLGNEDETGECKPAEGISEHKLRLHCDTWLPTGSDDAGSAGRVLPGESILSTDGLPTGEFRAVEGTPNDFRSGVLLGEAVPAIAEADPAWPHGGAMVVTAARARGPATWHTSDIEDTGTARGTPLVFDVGELSHEASGRRMQIFSTEPVAQLYFATLLDAGATATLTPQEESLATAETTPAPVKKNRGKNGCTYGRHGGVCIEMHRFPDSCISELDGLSAAKRSYVEEARPWTVLEPGAMYRQRTVYVFSTF